MMKAIEHVMELSGTGESKELAFNHIFSQIKPLIARNFPERVILQIEPKDIRILSATETAYTERFFGVLFPRRRIRYDIKAVVIVHLRFLELSDVSFEKRQDDLSPVKRVLTMR